ncbi:GNAT family N-acetyltransferase, partial [Streptomyces sp. NPDC006632]
MSGREYAISADPARLDPARIHHWLSTDAYWA